MDGSVYEHAGYEKAPTRVVIVDDSAFFRYELGERLAGAGWQVVASLGSGEEAVRRVPQLNPDLVMMDVVMPGQGGMWAVKVLRRQWGGFILMMSGHSGTGAHATWDALEAGANDFIPKPHPDHSLDDMVALIIERVKAWEQSQRRLSSAWAEPDSEAIGGAAAEPRMVGLKAVVIGASTGGPQALSSLFTMISGPPKVLLLVVQHMPEGFTTSFAERLGQRLGSLVIESPAAGRKLPVAPSVIVARGGQHLRVAPDGVWSEPGARRHGVIPSVDVTVSDAVRTFGRALGVVILTGMGEDGAEGAVMARQAGASVVAESRETALVWGMPRAVAERGAANAVWPIGRIGLWLQQVIQHGAL
jgi:two-component system chemotaxis response regulator CheB